jgi:protein gp37
MNKTRIEWLNGGYTWNPVTGCLHDCPYCYARRIAERFKMNKEVEFESLFTALYRADGLLELDFPIKNEDGRAEPFPHGFVPTIHRYRLDEPTKVKKPSNVFVGSMADLFGEWVPDEWIEQVFWACVNAPWHNYLFLTKNPERYFKLKDEGVLPAESLFWYGTTVNGNKDVDGERAVSTGSLHWISSGYDPYEETHINTFLSIEPLLSYPHEYIFECIDTNDCDWVIIGAETGNRKGKVIPKREWVEEITKLCKESKVPVFMKNSLRDLMGDDFVQEWPEGLQRTQEDDYEHV